LYSQPNTFYQGNVLLAGGTTLLNTNESTSAVAPQTSVYGSSNGTITNPSSPSELDANGAFMHDLNNGLDIVIERDIDNTA
jgi:hypothetical protein